VANQFDCAALRLTQKLDIYRRAKDLLLPVDEKGQRSSRSVGLSPRTVT
jgi:hypothetical protein